MGSLMFPAIMQQYRNKASSSLACPSGTHSNVIIAWEADVNFTCPIVSWNTQESFCFGGWFLWIEFSGMCLPKSLFGITLKSSVWCTVFESLKDWYIFRYNRPILKSSAKMDTPF